MFQNFYFSLSFIVGEIRLNILKRKKVEQEYLEEEK